MSLIKSKKISNKENAFVRLLKVFKSMFSMDDETKTICKIVFAKNLRNDIKFLKKPYIAIITTHIDLLDEEIVQPTKKVRELGKVSSFSNLVLA